MFLHSVRLSIVWNNVLIWTGLISLNFRSYRWLSRTGSDYSLLALEAAAHIWWAVTQSSQTWMMMTVRPCSAQGTCCLPVVTRMLRHLPSCCRSSWMPSMRKSGNIWLRVCMILWCFAVADWFDSCMNCIAFLNIMFRNSGYFL